MSGETPTGTGHTSARRENPHSTCRHSLTRCLRYEAYASKRWCTNDRLCGLSGPPPKSGFTTRRRSNQIVAMRVRYWGDLWDASQVQHGGDWFHSSALTGASRAASRCDFSVRRSYLPRTYGHADWLGRWAVCWPRRTCAMTVRQPGTGFWSN